MRLSYYWLPLLETAKSIIQSPGSNYDEVSTSIQASIEQVREQSFSLGFSTEQVTSAQFALVASIDEMAIKQDWQGAETWTKKPLQLIYFSTTRAGAEFFQKIDALDADDTEVKEVYALVLLSGYTGFYHSPEDEQLREYRESLFCELTQLREIAPLTRESKLFPAATASLENGDLYSKKRLKSNHIILLIIGVPLLCLAGMYFYYDYQISSMADEKVKAVSPTYQTKVQ